jgi:hypothetical protein
MDTALFTIKREGGEHLGARVVEVLREYGVAVVTEVFAPDQCDHWMSSIVDGICKINPQINSSSYSQLLETWTDYNLFPQTGSGLLQRGYSFLGWPVRGAPIIEEIFKEAFSVLRGKPISQTITSIDGVFIRPPIAPFHGADTPDWAHLDQTASSDVFQCIQAQVVLCDTTAGFRCSPKSFLVFEEILKRYNKLGDPGNWFMFRKEYYQDIRSLVESVGGAWQIPIIAPKGSMIFWLSSTIHSAKYADESSVQSLINKGIDPEHPWDLWRGVVYVCQRPKDEVDQETLHQLQIAYENNLSTNHWGKPFKPIPNRFKPNRFHPDIVRYLADPALVFDIPGLAKPALSEREKALIGLSD